jgi:hypothetical protein
MAVEESTRQPAEVVFQTEEFENPNVAYKFAPTVFGRPQFRLA